MLQVIPRSPLRRYITHGPSRQVFKAGIFANLLARNAKYPERSFAYGLKNLLPRCWVFRIVRQRPAFAKLSHGHAFERLGFARLPNPVAEAIAVVGDLRDELAPARVLLSGT